MRERAKHERASRRRRSRGRDRGQLSLPVVEAAVGVAFLLAVAASFGLALPAPATGEAQLNAYADDAVTVLASEPPRHAAGTRLAEVSRSPAAFDRERDALRIRVSRILGDNLLFRVETPHGAVGFERPAAVATGRATATTAGGEVALWVWYV